jgi:transposase
VRVWRPADQQPGPDEEAQVDYGWLGRWTNPVTGRTVTVWAFVRVLSCSRHLFVRPVIRRDQAAWSQAVQSHGMVAAFEFFGGVLLRDLSVDRRSARVL